MNDKLFNTVFEGFSAILLSMLEILPNILRIAILAATFVHILIIIKKEYISMPMGKYGYGKPKKKKVEPKKKKAVRKKK